MGAAASSKKKRRSLSAAQRVSPSDTEQVAHSLSNVESVESGGGGSGGSGGSIASSVARGTPESRPLQAKLVEAASGRADLDWTRLPSAGPAPLGSHIGAPMPPDEALRLATLHSYRVLDTERNDKVLDSITATLADSLGVEIALISLVDKDRQWFKSAVGLEAPETSRDMSFCSWAILPEADHEPQLFCVPDATQDERFAGSPLVLDNPDIRFYAGIPLVASNMQRIGSLCAISTKPRAGLKPHEETLLRALADMTMKELELRREATLQGALKALPHNLRTRKALQVVSHSLRTPLHAMVGGLELLADTRLTAEQYSLVEELRTAVADMQEVAKEISTMDNPGSLAARRAAGGAQSSVLRSPTSGRVKLPSISSRASEHETSPRSRGSTAGAAGAGDAGEAGETAEGGERVPADAESPGKHDEATPVLSDSRAAKPLELMGLDFASFKVLNVDDISTNRRILCRFLKRLGIEHEQQCENGLEAVKAVTREKFDVAFIDLQMPVMGGTTAAARIKVAGVNVPFLVAVTADASADAQDRCFSAGFDMFLPKPASFADIRKVLLRVAARNMEETRGPGTP